MSAARKAQFPVADQRRRASLAKVHIAAKDLKLVGDAYTDVLFGVTGKSSAGDCSDAELGAVIDRMKALGWKPAQPAGRTGARAQGRAGERVASRPADHKSAAKARALWISLHHLGVVGNASEMALEAFAKRQLGCERLQWAKQGQMFRLIEALKAMAERAGWDQSTDGLSVSVVPMVLRRRLADRIVEKMKAIDLIPEDWAVQDAAWRLAGIEMATLPSASELDAVAKALGDKLRTASAPMGEGR